MDESYQVAFDKLKRVLTSAPILAYPDFQLPFQLFTFSTSKVAHLAIAGCKKFLYFAATVVFDTIFPEQFTPRLPSFSVKMQICSIELNKWNLMNNVKWSF